MSESSHRCWFLT